MPINECCNLNVVSCDRDHDALSLPPKIRSKAAMNAGRSDCDR